MVYKVGDIVQTTQLENQAAVGKIVEIYGGGANYFGGAKNLVIQHYSSTGEPTGSSSIISAASSSLRKVPMPTKAKPSLVTPEVMHFDGQDVVQRFDSTGKIIKETVRPKKIIHTAPKEEVLPKAKPSEFLPKKLDLPSFTVTKAGRTITGAAGTTFTAKGKRFKITERGGAEEVLVKGLPTARITAFDDTSPPSWLKGGKKINEEKRYTPLGVKETVDVFINKQGTKVFRVTQDKYSPTGKLIKGGSNIGGSQSASYWK